MRRGFRTWRSLATLGAVFAIIALAAPKGFAQDSPSSSSSASSSPSGTSEGSVFIYGDTSEPSNLNPMRGYLGTDYVIWAMSYDIPINFSTTDFSPDFDHSIVTDVESSDDGLSFTYTMRDGMLWSDGVPFTAEDVAWSYNYYVKYQVSNYASDLALVKNVTVDDPTHFVIHTIQPTTIYSGETVFLYDYIIPKHVYGDPSVAEFPRQYEEYPAVNSGPYIISSYTRGENVVLDKNPNYWGNAIGLEPHYDQIIYQVYKDENQESAALQTGELDFGYFDSANIVNNLAEKPNIATRGAHVPSFDELGFNSGSSFQPDSQNPFYVTHGSGSHAAADPKFRVAVRQAVNSSELVDKVLLGYGTVANSPVQPTAQPEGVHVDAPPSLDFNLDNAKQSLTDAGYVDTDGDGIVNDPVTKENVVLRYFTRSSDENTHKAAPFVEDWLNQIGVGTQIKDVSSDKLTEIIIDGDYELFQWGWYPNPDPNYILGIFTCAERAPDDKTYGNNDSYYCNPEYDKLYAKQLGTTDVQERIDTIHQMQELLFRDQPYIMLYYSDVLEAYRTDQVEGMLPQPDPDGDWLATYGPLSFINIQPVAGAAAATSGGISGIVWVLIGVGVVVIVAAVILLGRRKSDDEA